jgi:ribosomal protein S18 acetylase RimI-like enzyme
MWRLRRGDFGPDQPSPRSRKQHMRLFFANVSRVEPSDDLVVRTELTDRDADAIVALHDRVYCTEFGFDARFAASVAWSIEAARAGGWPETGGGVWLVDRHGQLAGSLALITEADGVGRVRWFVLAPAARGRGLGRRLLGELLSQARAAGLRRLELETFSALTVAASIYLRAGFTVQWERETNQWGPVILFQGYALQLP